MLREEMFYLSIKENENLKKEYLADLKKEINRIKKINSKIETIIEADDFDKESDKQGAINELEWNRFLLGSYEKEIEYIHSLTAEEKENQ